MRRSGIRLWTILSVLALLFVPALFVLPSTAVDRLSPIDVSGVKNAKPATASRAG